MSKKTDRLEAELAELRRVLAAAAGTPTASACTTPGRSGDLDAYTLGEKETQFLSSWLKASSDPTFTITPDYRSSSRIQLEFAKLSTHGGVSITIREYR